MSATSAEGALLRGLRAVHVERLGPVGLGDTSQDPPQRGALIPPRAAATDEYHVPYAHHRRSEGCLSPSQCPCRGATLGIGSDQPGRQDSNLQPLSLSFNLLMSGLSLRGGVSP